MASLHWQQTSALHLEVNCHHKHVPKESWLQPLELMISFQLHNGNDALSRKLIPLGNINGPVCLWKRWWAPCANHLRWGLWWRRHSTWRTRRGAWGGIGMFGVPLIYVLADLSKHILGFFSGPLCVHDQRRDPHEKPEVDAKLYWRENELAKVPTVRTVQFKQGSPVCQRSKPESLSWDELACCCCCGPGSLVLLRLTCPTIPGQRTH